MRNKLLGFALFATIIISLVFLSGCSKKEEVSNSNELITLYNQLEGFIGKHADAVREQLEKDGFEAEGGIREYRKHYDDIDVYLNLGLNDLSFVFYIYAEFTTDIGKKNYVSDGDKFMDLVTIIGESHTIPSDLVIPFYECRWAGYVTRNWDKVIEYCDEIAISEFVGVDWFDDNENQIGIGRRSDTQDNKWKVYIYIHSTDWYKKGTTGPIF